MHIVIVGGGAMGTLLANGLSTTDHQISLVDLPERIAQIELDHGLKFVDLEGGMRNFTVDNLVADIDALRDLHEADYIFLATKAHTLPKIAQSVASVCGPNSTIVPIQNGIPWWYLYGADKAYATNPILRSVDPSGLLHQHIKISRVVGCVAYPAASLEADGSVKHVEGIRFPVGEFDGTSTERISELSKLLEDAGFKSRVIDDIHAEIWLKCWGALSINIVSALTRATMADICNHMGTQQLVRTMMSEAKSVAESLGVSIRHTIDKRIDGARSVGQHKPSTLQDVERGQTLELAPILGAVIELGQRTGVQTPTLDTIYACADLLNQGLEAKNC